MPSTAKSQKVRVPRLVLLFMSLLVLLLLMQIGMDRFLAVIQTPEIIVKRMGFTSTQRKILTTTHSSGVNSTSVDKIINRQVYIRSAFRVSDSEIRLTLLKDHKNNVSVHYKYGASEGLVSLECNLPKCLEMFSPKCTIIGYIGRVRNVDASSNHTHLDLWIGDEGQRIVQLPIIDVRPKTPPAYEHKLGVCVQPIYAHADFVAFVQFFEHWLDRGATKFYLYRHSYSKEVQAILDFYERQANASIELVDWSDLPSADPAFQPSRFLYRLEVMIAIFDCLHRARNTVKYVAQTDLDEFVIVGANDGNLIELMERLSKDNPTMAAASFQSRRAKFPALFQDISSPRDMNFNLMNEISVESYFFPRPIYSKLIHRPERALHGHIHLQIGAEPIPGQSSPPRKYTLANVPHTKAYILHLRRMINRNFKLYPFKKSSLLSGMANRWQQSFEQRLRGDKNQLLDSVEWKGVGLEVLRAVEKCRTGHENRRLKECHSVFDCGLNMTTDWIRAPTNAWTLLH